MYNNIINQLNENLSEIFLIEKKSISSFGVSFKEYDTFLELSDVRVSIDDASDKKWFNSMKKKVDTLKKDKKAFKEFESEYKKGNWKS